VSQFQRVISVAEDNVHLGKIPGKTLQVFLRLVNSVQKPQYTFAGPFSQILDDLDYAGNTAKEILETVQSGVTPAGYFHLAMMFGPLIFEPGVEK
jgi:hypothetical protein